MRRPSAVCGVLAAIASAWIAGPAWAAPEATGEVFETDCGADVLRVLSGAFRVPSRWTEVPPESARPNEVGRSLKDMEREVRMLGLESECCSVSLDRLEWIGFPIVACIRLPGGPRAHLVLLWDTTGDAVLVVDHGLYWVPKDRMATIEFVGGVAVGSRPFIPRRTLWSLAAFGLGFVATILVLRRSRQSRAAAIAALIAAVSLTGCGRNDEPHVVGPSFVDLGRGPSGPPFEVSTSFTISNPLDRPIEVESIQSSCACSHADLDPQRVPPHGTARLSVTVRIPDGEAAVATTNVRFRGIPVPLIVSTRGAKEASVTVWWEGSPEVVVEPWADPATQVTEMRFVVHRVGSAPVDMTQLSVADLAFEDGRFEIVAPPALHVEDSSTVRGVARLRPTSRGLEQAGPGVVRLKIAGPRVHAEARRRVDVVRLSGLTPDKVALHLKGGASQDLSVAVEAHVDIAEIEVLRAPEAVAAERRTTSSGLTFRVTTTRPAAEGERILGMLEIGAKTSPWLRCVVPVYHR